MTNHSKLAEDLRAALDAARNAIAANPDDGGTCNMDSLLLCVGSDRALRRFSKKLDAVLVEVHGRRFDMGWRGRGYLIHCGGGQGNSRTLGATTAAALLKARGWDAVVHYVTD